MSSVNARVCGSARPWFRNGRGQRVPLQVGRGQRGPGPAEPAGLGDVGGERAGMAQLPAEQVLRAGLLPQGGHLRGPPDGGHDRVIGQVRAHAGAVHDHADTDLAQVVGGPDAGQHEQLRAADGAGAQDDLALDVGGLLDAALQVPHPGGPAALHHDLGDARVGLDLKVGPRHGRAQVGVRGGAPAAILLGHLVEAAPVLLRAVEVVVGGQPALLGGGDPRLGHRRLEGQVGHGQRPGPAVVGIGTAGVALGPAEVRHQVGVAPAAAAVLVPPGVVVVPVAPDVDHGVHRRRPAEHPPARPVDGPPCRPLLGHGAEVPVVGALEQQVQRRRDVDLIGIVRWAGLEQQNPRRGVLGEAQRQDTSRTTGTNDDIVVHSHLKTAERVRKGQP